MALQSFTCVSTTTVAEQRRGFDDVPKVRHHLGEGDNLHHEKQRHLRPSLGTAFLQGQHSLPRVSVCLQIEKNISDEDVFTITKVQTY